MVIFFPQLGPEKSGNNALTAELVLEECDYDYEEIRYYLRERAAEAYQMKVDLSCYACMSTPAKEEINCPEI